MDESVLSVMQRVCEGKRNSSLFCRFSFLPLTILDARPCDSPHVILSIGSEIHRKIEQFLLSFIGFLEEKRRPFGPLLMSSPSSEDTEQLIDDTLLKLYVYASRFHSLFLLPFHHSLFHLGDRFLLSSYRLLLPHGLVRHIVVDKRSSARSRIFFFPFTTFPLKSVSMSFDPPDFTIVSHLSMWCVITLLIAGIFC
jgi:hypothetical protein